MELPDVVLLDLMLARSYHLDPKAERPRLAPRPIRQATPDAPLVIDGPDEELVRFVSGRHFLPGATSNLKVTHGTAQDLAALRRAFR